MAYKVDNHESNLYRNQFGKSRPIDADSIEQSRLRKEYFAEFSAQLCTRLIREGFISPQAIIVGSVAKDQATINSDIDFIVKYSSQTKIDANLAERRIRCIVYEIITDMQQSNNYLFELHFFTNHYDLFTSAVQMYRLAQTQKK